MAGAYALWRRIDAPGHDFCRLSANAAGWQIDGLAIFKDGDNPAGLQYHVECGLDWQAIKGLVNGWIGSTPVEILLKRLESGSWAVNSAMAPDLDALPDLDFGFTPATNLFAIRRLNLQIGEAADAPAAWLDVSSGKLSLLRQRYERRNATEYWYQAPDLEYSALLEVTEVGFIHKYPGLWEMEG